MSLMLSICSISVQFEYPECTHPNSNNKASYKKFESRHLELFQRTFLGMMRECIEDSVREIDSESIDRTRE
jgi:hypothetical protein